MPRGKLLYIITLAGPGGAQSHVADLIRHFVVDYDVHLAVGTHGPLTEAVLACGGHVHLMPSLRRSVHPFGDARAIRDCVGLIQILRPTLVHAHSSKAGLIARVAGRIAGVPVIFTAHGWGFAPGAPLVQRCAVLASERLAAGLSARIICVSQYDARLAQRMLGSGAKVVTIHHGLPPSSLVANPASSPPSLIMTARFQHQKHQALALHAFAAQSAEATSFLFVGDGPELAAHQALARELEIADRTQFLGDRADVPALLQQAQIFVLFSRYEGLPISILEAMRAGLPVLATDVGGVSELVSHGRSGFVIPPGDLQAASRAMHLLIADANVRHTMGNIGQQIFEQQFRLETMLERTAALYGEVTGER